MKMEKLNTDTSYAIIVATETELRKKPLGNLRYLYAPFEDTEYGGGSLTPKIARKIVSYYDGIPADSCEILFLVCDAGQSRSAALAAALLNAEGQDDIKSVWSNPRYNPNPLVYRLVLQVFGKRVSNAKIRRLVHINDKARKKQIKQRRRQQGGRGYGDDNYTQRWI